MITLALISPAHADQARSLAQELQEAVSAGRVTQVDALSNALLKLANWEGKVVMGDELWFEINRKLRQWFPDYAAPYLLDPATLDEAHEKSDRTVSTDFFSVLEAASDSGCLLLQLPTDSNE